MAASSLASLVDARARLARAELAALEDRMRSLASQRDDAQSASAGLQSLIDIRGRLRDRVLRDALRAVAIGAPSGPRTEEATLAAQEQASLVSAVRDRAEQLTADTEELGATLESVAAKEDELRRLEARSRALLVPSPSAGQLLVLRDLADEASQVASTIDELLRGSATPEAATLAWSWPVAGQVTQRFGPSALTLEPAVTYLGVAFAHFHDGVDIAAPLGTAVTAAANGRVAFVGHLPDGAMVVVIQHDDGFASLSAHLDDAFAPPPVRAGDRVTRGDVIGYVGMTGVTTGPHLHFTLHLAGAPVDPLSVLPR
jgi:murein DD-endopeptidase MepM/ murein hydrolase activator NlpD